MPVYWEADVLVAPWIHGSGVQDNRWVIGKYISNASHNGDGSNLDENTVLVEYGSWVE